MLNFTYLSPRPSTGASAYEHYFKNRVGKGLDGDTDLNTNVRETPEQRQRRLLFSGFFDFATDILFEETVAPPDTETLNQFIEELYNPMLDAKCFNDHYNVPSPHKAGLYRDYKKIFDWGLKNPSGSPLFAGSAGVTANRFPSMCLRMAFHDNAINGKDGSEYVESMINSAGEWIGPDMMMETSGGDASVLTCKPERYHPNNNYDQTASRILHAFQNPHDYPRGPGIGYGYSLMSKYKMSYADALHNCALAALKYMTESEDLLVRLDFDIDDSERDSLKYIYHKFSFGRKDACYITKDIDLIFSEDGLAANSRRPLCGPSDVLPGVNFSAREVFDWFDSRGLPVGVWLSLFGTHTALDNFSDPKIIRYFGLPDKDYFEDFVGCPFHTLLDPVVVPDEPGCDWTPNCKNPDNKNKEPWKLVRSDCSTSLDMIQAAADPDLEMLEKQMQVYVDQPGSWLPDIICALNHLGGDSTDCVGPYGLSSPQHSMFGSFWRNDYPVPEPLKCDYTCPANSSRDPNVKCLQDFSGCVCNDGYVVEGNTCVAAPVTSSTSSCCSWDAVNCPRQSEWCDASKGNCEGGCAGMWVDPTAPRTCRIPLWGACTKDTTGCCAGTCQGNLWYRQCV